MQNTAKSSQLPGQSLGQLKGPKDNGIRSVTFSSEALHRRFNALLDTLLEISKTVTTLVGGKDPEQKSTGKKIWEQINQSNHCGNMAEQTIAALIPHIKNTVSPISFDLYQEFLGEQSPPIGEFNHARVLIVSPKAIIVVDPWYENPKIYNADPKTGIFTIPNTLSSNGAHRYRLKEGLLQVIDSGKGMEQVDLLWKAKSKFLPHTVEKKRPEGIKQG